MIRFRNGSIGSCNGGGSSLPLSLHVPSAFDNLANEDLGEAVDSLDHCFWD